MNIKLIEMTLKNFKNQKLFHIKMNGENINIYGENGSGKTTIFDAYSWLLFDKSSLGVSAFEMKPIGMVRPQVEVSATLMVDTREIRLKKMLEENWTKKRGDNEESFSGHATSYWINEIPKKANEYKAFIDTLVTEETFKRLTDAGYFLSMKKPDMRRVLIDMASNVTDRTVAEDDVDLLNLVEKMEDNAYSVDDLLKLSKQNVSLYNKEQEQINPRIDELNHSMPDEAPTIRFKEGLLKGEEYIRSIDETLLRSSQSATDLSKQSSKVQDLKNRIEDRVNALIRIENSKKNELLKVKNESDMTITQLTGKLESLVQRKLNLESNVNTCTENLLRYKAQYLELKDKFNKRSATEYKPVESIDGTATCPTCFQTIPYDAEQANADMKLHFEEEKAIFLVGTEEEMKKVATQGSEEKARKTNYELQLADVVKSIDETGNELLVEKGRYNAIKERIESFVDVTEISTELLKKDAEYVTLNKELDDTKVISINAEEPKVDVKALMEDRAKVTEQIETLKEKIREQELREKSLARIEELVARGRELSQLIADAKAVQYQCERFIQKKAKLLQENINGLFDNLSFRLFDVQINGGIADDCTPMINGVEYKDASNSERIRANADIVSAMQKHENIYLPYFSDNSEACTHFRKMECQTIKMFVDKSELRFEKEN